MRWRIGRLGKLLDVRSDHFAAVGGVFFALSTNLYIAVVTSNPPPQNTATKILSAAAMLGSGWFWLTVSSRLYSIQRLVEKAPTVLSTKEAWQHVDPHQQRALMQLLLLALVTGIAGLTLLLLK